MFNNNIRTDSEIHKFINSEFRNYRLRLEWPLGAKESLFSCRSYLEEVHAMPDWVSKARFLLQDIFK